MIIRLDRMMADRKVSSTDLAREIGLTPVMLSRIKTGKIKAFRLETLVAICEALDCNPGDLMELVDDEEEN